MISRTSIALSLVFLTPLIASAATPCEILTKGNTDYSAKRLDSALAVYKEVESVDKNGKDRCTASIYATVGTIHTLAGREAKDSAKALNHFKNAARYNRAFANALMCNAGSCGDSEQFWANQDFYK